MDIENAVFKIISSDPENKKFGTGFMIHQKNDVAFILTCAHVIRDVGGADVVQAGHFPATVVALGMDKTIYDLAVLKITNTSFNHRPLTLCLFSKSGKPFIAMGYQLFDTQKQIFLLRVIRGMLGHQVSLEERHRQGRIKAWDLKIEGDHFLKPGYSGSPVIDSEYGHVIGVVSHQIGKGDKGLAISVEMLQHIWPDMPSTLLFGDRKEHTKNPSASSGQKKQKRLASLHQGNISITNTQTVNMVVDGRSAPIVQDSEEKKNHAKKPDKKMVHDHPLPEKDPTTPYPSHIPSLEIDPAKIKEIFDIWVQKQIAVIGCVDMGTALSAANLIINRLTTEVEKRLVVLKDSLGGKPIHLLTELSENQFGWKAPTGIVVELHGAIAHSFLEEHMFNRDRAASLVNNLRTANRFILCIADQGELKDLLENNVLSSPVIPKFELDNHLPFQSDDPLPERNASISGQERQAEQGETQRDASHSIKNIKKDPGKANSKTRESSVPEQKGAQPKNIESIIDKFMGRETASQQIMVLYAEHDVKHASRLYNDLIVAGYDVWMDIISILPGQDRVREISLAIKNADIIVPLFSRYTMSKRGYFHKELRMAYDILQQSPDGFICLIPALVEECPLPVYLDSLAPLPLYPIWQEGINQLIKSIEYQQTMTPSAHR